MASSIYDDDSSDSIISEDSVHNITEDWCDEPKPEQNVQVENQSSLSAIQKIINRQVCFSHITSNIKKSI